MKLSIEIWIYAIFTTVTTGAALAYALSDILPAPKKKDKE